MKRNSGGHFLYLVYCFLIFIAPGEREKKTRERRKSNNLSRGEIIGDPDRRLEAIKNEKFSPVSLMNQGEKEAYEYMKWLIGNRRLNLSVFPQVPLIAYIKQKNTTEKTKNIHSGLRPDFTVVNEDGMAVVVVEINGGGHHWENDDVKKAVLEKAGIRLLAVNTGDSQDVKSLVNRTFWKYLKDIYPERERVYLQVPYKDNEKVKEFGGWWDEERRLWHVPVDELAIAQAFGGWNLAEQQPE